MRAVQVKCPNCGAAVNAGDGERITCEYCGTVAVVQRRTGMFQRAMPMPAMQVKLPVAVQQRAIAGIAILMAAFFGVFALVAGMIVCTVVKATDRATRAARSRSSSQSENAGLEGGGPLLIADLDGDRVLDLVGRRRDYSADEIAAVVLDLETGREKWRSESLGTYSDTYLGRLFRVVDLLMFVSEKGEVVALELASGKRRWKARLPERVVSVCDAGDAMVVTTKDRVRRALRTADGELIDVPDGNCAAVADDREERQEQAEHDVEEAAGLQSAYAYPGPDGTRVLAGTRAIGSRVAQLALVGADGKVRWTADLPADPLAVMERKASAVGVGESLVCGSYYTDSVAKPERLACLTLADGGRRWDVVLGDDSVSALQIADRTVLVSTSGLLEARDAATGDVRWRYGKP